MTHTKKRGGLIKLATGIQGFDQITGGGLPQNRTTLIMGAPGSGKTVFAVQSLVGSVQRGEAAILVTFQESPRQVVENAAGFGWDLAELERDKLVILDARIRPDTFKSIELYLTGMLAGIKLVANEMKARWVVFDSLDAVLALLEDPTAERQEIFRLRNWLLESGLTAIMTMQADGNESSSIQRLGFMQSVVDCIVCLERRAGDSGSQRSLRVQKYRGSGFVEESCPFVIGTSGIEVRGALGHEAPTNRSVSAQAAELAEDLEQARNEFHRRLESMNRQLEIKQAELEFLLKAEAKSTGRGIRQRKPASASALGARKTTPTQRATQKPA